MKALIIVLATVVVLAAIRVIEVLASRQRIKSVGGRSNNASKRIARYDISDQESLNELVNTYKDMAD